jgi:phosphate butyryltransferase
MITTFSEIIMKAKKSKSKRIAVVNAHDIDSLTSIREAVDEKIITPILIGDKEKIKKILIENSFEYNAEIISSTSNDMSAKIAVDMVASNDADILMKGMISSKILLKAVLKNKNMHDENRLLSHIALFAPEEYGHTILLSDAGLNIDPTLLEKKMIIENAVQCALSLEIKNPKVAILASVEEVNPNMQATLDAAVLSKMNQRGQIKGCIVDGPLALDNAVSEKSAKIKKIYSPVAGKADILIAPEINVGNAIYKTLAFFAKCPHAGVIVGASCPIVFSSRADSYMTKLNSIAFACILRKQFAN